VALAQEDGADEARVLQRGLIGIQHHPSDALLATHSLDVVEGAVAEFGRHLPMGDAPIQIIIAHSAAEFRSHAAHLGFSHVNGIARPSAGLIVVKAPHIRTGRGDYAGTLRHELVHVLLARNVNTAYLPKWLNEGLCMFLANENYWNSVFTIGRMYVQGRIIEYRDLDLRFAMPGDEQQFGDAYAQAISMTRYLYNMLGEDAFWAVILGTRDLTLMDSLRTHAGMSTRDFWDAYRRSLWKFALLGSVGSGSIFVLPACLLIIAVIRKRFKNRHILRRWADEERLETDETVFSWDDVAEEPYEWEEQASEERDKRWRG
jgi:hypothetical protein